MPNCRNDGHVFLVENADGEKVCSRCFLTESVIEIYERIYIFIACVKKKAGERCEAKDLYQSTWFRAARAFAEASGKKWFILSAKYHLLSPDDVIEPYDQTLLDMTRDERIKWSQEVIRQILEKLPLPGQAVFLAGKNYREFIIPELGRRNFKISVPMRQKGIGQQIQWLQNEIKSDRII